MAKRYQAKRRATEDASGLAGWLFTDLLLGLVMIFLSAAAFTAFKSKDEVASVGASVETFEVCTEYFAAYDEEPLILDFKSEEEASLIDEKIKEHIAKNYKFGSKPEVAVGLIYGYYGESDDNEGNNRAKSFYLKFVESDPENFKPFDEKREVKNMKFFGSKGRFAPVNGVQAQLFFVFNACGNTERVTSTTLP